MAASSIVTEHSRTHPSAHSPIYLPTHSPTQVLLHLLKEEVDTLGPRPIIHFIEDRFETLKQVSETPGLEEIKLYLVGKVFFSVYIQVLSRAISVC